MEGYRETTVGELKEGDEIIFYTTLFEQSFGKKQEATVIRISRPEEDYPEWVRVEHTGGVSEAEEGEVAWVKNDN